MLLTFRKEQEHGIFISKDITDENEYKYPAYRQAIRALCSTIRQAQPFYLQGSPVNEVGIYGYCHNIIAFSGSRGQGKTSTMLSFSKALEKSFWENSSCQDDILRKCSFKALPPIDPTVLEQDQSILAVILSRMYRTVENVWSSPSRHGLSDEFEPDEAARNALLRRFQQCLSGINSIKFREGREIKGLIEMHEISDSAVLKDSLYELTKYFLKFIQQDQNGLMPFLIVPLDDTDFQVCKSYEIMEDIRKYLTIPNMIILMATDLNMLRATLTQHFIQDFRDGLTQKIVSIDQLQKVESKYLNKLIPPTHAVYLPRLDDVVRRQNAAMHIHYVRENRLGEEENLLLPPNYTGSDTDLSLQNLIFRYVYRKTRIAFADHKTHIHELLPTTLRGLAQFLVVFSSMEDVPEITEREANSSKDLAEKVRKQVDILEINLTLFEDYFLNDWIHTKLSVEKVGMIKKLLEIEPEVQHGSAITLLYEMYKDFYPEIKTNPYYNLFSYIEELEGLSQHPDDTYFFFALRMFFDLQAHKALILQKREAVKRLEQEKNGLLIFDFSSCAMNLPATLYLDDDSWSGLTKEFRSDQYERIANSASDKNLHLKLMRPAGKKTYYFDPSYFIAFFLSLGNAAYREAMRGETNQAALYFVQTSCATIAINHDVQDAIQKALAENAPSKERTFAYLDDLKKFLSVINHSIQEINGGVPGMDPMILSWIDDILSFMDEADNRSGFRGLLVRLKRELTTDHLRPLCNIYRCAQALLTTAKTPENMDEVRRIWNSFVDMSIDYSLPHYKSGLDLQLLDDLLNSSTTPELAAAVFWTEFSREFPKLCKELGYRMSVIKKALNNT